MSLPIEAAVPLFALGWVAGVGTVLACRPARSGRTCRELMRDPPGWRSYAPVSRSRHANSDNGAPSTAKPPIEQQGQAPVRPSFPPPRKIREGFTAEETQGRSQYEQSLPRFQAYWASLDTDSQAIANAAARRSGIWQPQAHEAVQQLADEGDRDPAEAVSNDASKLRMRHDMAMATSPPPGIWQPRATGQGDPLPPPANP